MALPCRIPALLLNTGEAEGSKKQRELRSPQKRHGKAGEIGTERGILLKLGDDGAGGKTTQRHLANGNSGGSSSMDTGGTSSTMLHFGHSTRYLVLFLTTLCLSLAMSNSVALNFTVICMNRNVVVASLDSAANANATNEWQTTTAIGSFVVTSNGTSDQQHSDPNPAISVVIPKNIGQPPLMGPLQPMFDNTQRAVLFSAVPVGTLFGTVPVTAFDVRYGMRKTFFLYGLLSAFATLFTPISAHVHFTLLLLMRFLQGVAVAICFPACGAIISQWCPLRSAGTVIALLSCHIQFGPILTMPLAGELCESRWGWPALYYIQAFLTVLSFVAFFAFVRDSPRQHRNVSSRELGNILHGKSPMHFNDSSRKEIPYGAMLRDPAVWGIFMCSIGTAFGFYVFMQYGPIYLNKTLKFDVERTGFAVALPSLLSLVVKFIVGPISDYATFMSDRIRVILFASISQILMALCFLALALLPPDSPRWLLQMCFTAVTVVCGINCAGVGKSAQLISCQYAPALMSFSVFAISTTIILIPVLVSALAPDNEPYQWARIFLIVAAVIVCCLLVFACTAEASPRPWTMTAQNWAKQSVGNAAGGESEGGEEEESTKRKKRGDEEEKEESTKRKEEEEEEESTKRKNRGDEEEEEHKLLRSVPIRCAAVAVPRGSAKEEQRQRRSTTAAVTSAQ